MCLSLKRRSRPAGQERDASPPPPLEHEPGGPGTMDMDPFLRRLLCWMQASVVLGVKGKELEALFDHFEDTCAFPRRTEGRPLRHYPLACFWLFCAFALQAVSAGDCSESYPMVGWFYPGCSQPDGGLAFFFSSLSPSLSLVVGLTLVAHLPSLFPVGSTRVLDFFWPGMLFFPPSSPSSFPLLRLLPPRSPALLNGKPL